MSAYMIAQGHDNAGSLATVTPQPRTRGMKDGRRTMAGDGLYYADGFRSQTWYWGYLTITQYDALLTAFGLGEGTPSARVTVKTRQNQGRTFNNYNATIVMPDPPENGAVFELGRWSGREIEFQLTRLEQI